MLGKQVRPLSSTRNSSKNSQAHAEKRVRPAPELGSLPPDPNRGGIREVASMLQARVLTPKHVPEPVCCSETKEEVEPTTPSKPLRSKDVSTPEESKGKKRQSPSPATVPSKKRNILGLVRILLY